MIIYLVTWIIFIKYLLCDRCCFRCWRYKSGRGNPMTLLPWTPCFNIQAFWEQVKAVTWSSRNQRLPAYLPCFSTTPAHPRVGIRSQTSESHLSVSGQSCPHFREKYLRQAGLVPAPVRRHKSPVSFTARRRVQEGAGVPLQGRRKLSPAVTGVFVSEAVVFWVHVLAGGISNPCTKELCSHLM